MLKNCRGIGQVTAPQGRANNKLPSQITIMGPLFHSKKEAFLSRSVPMRKKSFFVLPSHSHSNYIYSNTTTYIHALKATDIHYLTESPFISLFESL